jgi:hypothetical protein
MEDVLDDVSGAAVELVRGDGGVAVARAANTLAIAISRSAPAARVQAPRAP